MFPNGDTLFEYVSMRQQADRAHAARQRLAASSVGASGTRPLALATCEGLVRVFHGVRAFVRDAVAGRSAARPGGVAERTEAAARMA